MRLDTLGRPTRRLIAILLLGFLALALGPSPARAQAPSVPGAPAAAAPAPAPEIDRKQLEALLRTLEDPAARDALAGQIRALLTVKKEAEPGPVVEPGALGAQTLRFLSQQLRGLGEQAGAVTTAFRDLPLAADWFERQLTDEYRRDRWWDIILQLAAAIFAGFLASAFVSWLLRHPRAALESRHEPHWVQRLPLLLGRTALELLPIAAFAVAGYGLLSLSEPPRLIRVVALTVINATLFIQLVMVLARAAFTPGVPNLRLLPMEGETAHYGYIWVRRLAYTSVYGYLVSNAAFVLGLPLGAYTALLKLVGLVVAAMLVVLILQNRAHVAAWMRGAPLSGGSAEAEARDIARGTTSASPTSGTSWPSPTWS
jgi:small conductance mechanosensitive channel